MKLNQSLLFYVSTLSLSAITLLANTSPGALDPATNKAMPLSEFLTLAQSDNLDIKIEAAKSDAAHAQSYSLGIPAPSLGWILSKDFAGSSINFEVAQTVPFPLRIRHDSLAKGFSFDSQNELQSLRQREILASGRLLYFLVWALQTKLELLDEKLNLTREHILLARSQTRSNSFASVHLLKAESAQDLLLNEISTANLSLKEKLLEAAVFLNQDPATFSVRFIEPTLTETPVQIIYTQSHYWKAQSLELSALESKRSSAQMNWLPDFNFRFKKMGTTQETMIGITLPFLFFWEPQSESRRMFYEYTRKELENTQSRIQGESKILALGIRVTSLKSQIDNMNLNLIPRAEKRVKLVHNLAPRDLETLQDHLETMEALPDLKMLCLDLKVQLETATLELTKYEK